MLYQLYKLTLFVKMTNVCLEVATFTETSQNIRTSSTYPGVLAPSEHKVKNCKTGGHTQADYLYYSTAGDILTASRSTLKPQYVDVLLFLKKNMHISIKYWNR